MKEIRKQLAEKKRYGMADLLAIMETLRAPDGCPWDAEQDHHTIRKNLIEETYEVVEAIDTEDDALLREELGDVLLQVVFHARIAEEAGAFSFADVVNDICAKLVHRHPHVFGTVQADTSEQVLQNWESIKTEEKQRNTLVEKLRAIPPMMPALMRASKVSKKVGRASDKTADELMQALEAQISQMRNVDAPIEKKEQIGELLMSVTDLARVWGVDAEHALAQRTDALIECVAEGESGQN